MLSCNDVREHLAAIETGEPAPGEVRDHLASCETCRAEAASVRRDLATLRGELASLAPSPFLEDAVLDAAREEVAATTTPRRPWLPAGIGIAAAAVLAVLVFVAKLPGDERAAGEGAAEDPGGPSLVEIPPTAAQVAAARKARLAKLGTEVETTFYELLGAPEPGTAILGRRLIERMGRKEHVDVGGEQDEALARLVKKRAGYVTVQVSAPGGKGPSALVRGRLDDTYAGNLLLEQTLGRALGLQDHEIPGGVTVGGDLSMRGERAQAHVRIGGFEGATEVEVVREGVPLPAVPLQGGGVPQAMRLVIRGELPDVGFTGSSIEIHHAHGTSFVVADATVGWRNDRKDDVELGMLKQGPLQSALGYHAGAYPECLVFLPSLDLGGGGPLAWALRMERVTLKPAFEPGAMVTIARVWRGRTAIPSRESVAHTTADEKGAASFVHVRGERGPLRAREVRKDGTVVWHELPGEDPAPVAGRKALVLDAAGDVHFLGTTFPVWPATGGGAAPDPTLFPVWSAPDATALTALRAALLSSAETQAKRNEPLTVALVAVPSTQWKRLETLLLTCAEVGIRKLELGFPADHDGTPYELPTDASLPVVPSRVRRFTVRIEWKGADLRWRTTGVVGDHEGPLDDSDDGLVVLEKAMRLNAPAGFGGPLEGEVNPVGAAQRALPYAAVRAVIERMQAAKIDRILIATTPPRRAR